MQIYQKLIFMYLKHTHWPYSCKYAMYKYQYTVSQKQYTLFLIMLA